MPGECSVRVSRCLAHPTPLLSPVIASDSVVKVWILPDCRDKPFVW
jgi:hypothetical protein